MVEPLFCSSLFHFLTTPVWIKPCVFLCFSSFTYWLVCFLCILHSSAFQCFSGWSHLLQTFVCCLLSTFVPFPLQAQLVWVCLFKEKWLRIPAVLGTLLSLLIFSFPVGKTGAITNKVPGWPCLSLRRTPGRFDLWIKPGKIWPLGEPQIWKVYISRGTHPLPMNCGGPDLGPFLMPRLIFPDFPATQIEWQLLGCVQCFTPHTKNGTCAAIMMVIV